MYIYIRIKSYPIIIYTHIYAHKSTYTHTHTYICSSTN